MKTIDSQINLLFSPGDISDGVRDDFDVIYLWVNHIQDKLWQAADSEINKTIPTSRFKAIFSDNKSGQIEDVCH